MKHPPPETLAEPESRHGARIRAMFAAWRRSSHASTALAAAAGAVLAIMMIGWPAVFSRVPRVVAARGEAKDLAVKSPSIVPALNRPLVDQPADDVDGAAERKAPTEAIRPTAEDVAESVEQQSELPSPSEDAIVPAAFQTTESVVRLSADNAWLDIAKLSAGQTVRGDPKGRPLITVPAEGIEVAAENITFENVDFMALEPLTAGGAMLTLRGLKTSFQGCSFTASEAMTSDDLPVAIRWDRNLDPEDSPVDLTASELQIRDTAFQGVGIAVSCRMAGDMVVRVDNVLHLGLGPCMQVDRFPEAGESLTLIASRATLRGARCFVEVGCDELPEAVGRLEIEAADCAFIMPPAAALVVYHGAARPGPLLKGLRWNGQGSVLSPHSRLAMWRMPEGRMFAAADEAVPIEGVARGEVRFAGEPNEGSAGSCIVSWQAPLNFPHPPGIDDSRLYLRPAIRIAD